MSAPLPVREERVRVAYPPCRSILMIGTHLSTQGGIPSVVRQYEAGGLFDSYPCVYVHTHKQGPATRKIWNALAGWARTLRHLITLPAPLVHIHMSSRASFWRKSVVCLMSSALMRPYIVHMHGSEFMAFHEECGSRARAFIRHILARATLVIALSPQWRENLQRICPEARVEVIPNGVDLPDLPAREPEDASPRILALGRVGRRKGTFELLQAFATLAHRYPSWRLVCAGDGDLEQLRAAAAATGLRHRVDVPGWLSAARAREVVARASIFALPSHAEGLPMALLEAMSWSVPVVSTSVGGIPHVLENDVNGLLIEPGDVRRLTACLDRLMRDASERRRLGLAARATIEAEYSREAMLRQLRTLYDRFGLQPAIRDESTRGDGARDRSAGRLRA